MFRRAANIIARVEDRLVFAGQTGPNPQPGDIKVEPHIFRVTGGDAFSGLAKTAKDEGSTVETDRVGEHLVKAVVEGIAKLEEFGHLAPFALVLGPDLFSQRTTQTRARWFYLLTGSNLYWTAPCKV